MARKRYVDDWADHVPMTSRAARPMDYEDVKGGNVVHVSNAQYRGAKFSGTFELVDVDHPWRLIKGEMRLELKVYWFGHRPPTRFPAVRVKKGNYSFERNYSKAVARNLGT